MDSELSPFSFHIDLFVQILTSIFFIFVKGKWGLFIVIPELSHGSLWLAVARRFVALSLGIYVIARNPNTRQRL